jgi:hypothetical protein
VGCPALTLGADHSDHSVASTVSAPARLNAQGFKREDTNGERPTLLEKLDGEGRWMAGKDGREARI